MRAYPTDCFRKLIKTLSLDETRLTKFNLFFDLEEYSEEEVAETMTETMEQYMRKTQADYGSGIARPKIDDINHFELKGQFIKELRDNTFSDSDHEDTNEHIKKVLEIVDLFHIPIITQDQVMLRALPMSLTRAVSRWLRNKPSSSITTWEDLKTKFLRKYCLPARTVKKMEEINNFQQEPDETIYQAWERFKELLTKTGSTKTFDGLAAIQARLNNLRREIKKVNEKVYAAQVECEQCKGPHYTKDFPLKEEGASVNVMPLSTYLNLGLGELAHTNLIVDLANMTVKYLKGIAKNVLPGLREIIEPDLEARLMGENMVLNRSLDPLYGDYIELNDLNVSLDLRRNQVDGLMPAIEEGG
nr:hypothetical protein [Tanacetum cinerariifolium]